MSKPAKFLGYHGTTYHEMKNEHEASVWYPVHSECKLGLAQDVSQEFFFPPQSLQKTLQEYFYVIQEQKSGKVPIHYYGQLCHKQTISLIHRGIHHKWPAKAPIVRQRAVGPWSGAAFKVLAQCIRNYLCGAPCEGLPCCRFHHILNHPKKLTAGTSQSIYIHIRLYQHWLLHSSRSFSRGGPDCMCLPSPIFLELSRWFQTTLVKTCSSKSKSFKILAKVRDENKRKL